MDHHRKVLAMTSILLQGWRKLFAHRIAPDIPGDDEARRAEQLEHIARYAQAGFFSAGHSVELLPLAGVALPH
jgi:hypothetical protein